MIVTPAQLCFPSDAKHGDLDGDDMPDVRVGRIPARTAGACGLDQRHRTGARFANNALKPLRGAAEIAIQSVIELEVGSEALGDGEDQGRVGDAGKDLFDEVLGPHECAFLAAARTESTSLARKRDEALLGAVAAAQAQETEVRPRSTSGISIPLAAQQSRK